jgi:hypothetical protein
MSSFKDLKKVCAILHAEAQSKSLLKASTISRQIHQPAYDMRSIKVPAPQCRCHHVHNAQRKLYSQLPSLDRNIRVCRACEPQWQTPLAHIFTGVIAAARKTRTPRPD